MIVLLDMQNSGEEFDASLISPSSCGVRYVIAIQTNCVVAANLLLTSFLMPLNMPLAGVAVASVVVNWRSFDCSIVHVDCM